MSTASTAAAALVRLEREALADTERALGLEWLETDGLGGYGSSTVLQCPTRRYHGLLVSTPVGSGGRHVFVSRFEEEVDDGGGGAFALSVARYGETLAPQGHEALERFELVPYPRATYRRGDTVLVREGLSVRGATIALCRWTLVRAPRSVTLRARPFFPCRPADALTVENGALDGTVREGDGAFEVRPYPVLPAVCVAWSGGGARFAADPHWYRGLRFEADEARGYEGYEDQWTPGLVQARLAPGESLVVACSLDERVTDPAALWEVESELRREELPAEPDSFDRASLAADAFLYRDAKGRTGVVAGYPWFVEWGRDTFLSLPGLTLARGRIEECAQALEGAVRWMRGGLLPNVFGTEPATSHYGSADAALWFARAVFLYGRAAHDRERMLGAFRTALTEVAEAYCAGAALGLEVDDAGCLYAGDPDTNATWMDARTSAGPVTPRDGCAVELNALWYSLLAHLEDLAAAVGDRAARKRWTELRRRLRRSFLERFWLEDGGYLADVWRDGEPDRRVRPNMVLAAALEQSPLTRGQRGLVVERARRELLTPRGLRTLSPADPDYVGRYGGGPEERDAAYHQGTVWPWLLGSYVEASLRARGTKRAVRDELLGLWRAFDGESVRAGLGHVSEVFDGDPPHRPGGTIAQAWNTAECLRSLALLRKPAR